MPSHTFHTSLVLLSILPFWISFPLLHYASLAELWWHFSSFMYYAFFHIFISSVHPSISFFQRSIIHSDDLPLSIKLHLSSFSLSSELIFVAIYLYFTCTFSFPKLFPSFHTRCHNSLSHDLSLSIPLPLSSLFVSFRTQNRHDLFNFSPVTFTLTSFIFNFQLIFSTPRFLSFIISSFQWIFSTRRFVSFRFPLLLLSNSRSAASCFSCNSLVATILSCSFHFQGYRLFIPFFLAHVMFFLKKCSRLDSFSQVPFFGCSMSFMLHLPSFVPSFYPCYSLPTSLFFLFNVFLWLVLKNVQTFPPIFLFVDVKGLLCSVLCISYFSPFVSIKFAWLTDLIVNRSRFSLWETLLNIHTFSDIVFPWYWYICK